MLRDDRRIGDDGRHAGAPTNRTALAGRPRLAPAPAEESETSVPSSNDATAARTRAERMIEERLGSTMLTVANLCRWTGMSRSSLYRLFDADGGVQAFIRMRRLDRVAQELRGGSGRVATIAERWGFCDAAYLARVFREVHGMTPSAYRAVHSGADRQD